MSKSSSFGDPRKQAGEPGDYKEQQRYNGRSHNKVQKR